MATKYPRTYLTIPPNTKCVYERTAKLMGIPTSKLITKVIEESVADILMMGDVIEKHGSDPIKMLKHFSAISHSANDVNQTDIVDLIDQIGAKK